jgi:lincosamide nucleotidyltransferase A/C/D/E
MSMSSSEVLEILDILEAKGIAVWIGGGWGVDALVGHETRSHEDVDIAVDTNDQGRTIDALIAVGFSVVEEQDWRPSRVLLQDPAGRAVDLHPLVFDGSGDALQANVGDLPPFRYPSEQFVYGTVSGRRVRCIGTDLQIRFHSGYELDSKGRHDLRQLTKLNHAEAGRSHVEPPSI